MIERIIIWGGVSFGWQLIAGVILPRLFIFELGNEAYGELSFFFILLNPVFWFDFTGNINKGLLVVLPDLDPRSGKTDITVRYAATPVWWFIVWGFVAGFACFPGIRFFSWTALGMLLLLPIAITGIYRLVIDWYSEQRYSRIYLLQTLASVAWVAGCWILTLYFPAKNAILLSTLGVAILGLLYRFICSHTRIHRQIKLLLKLFNPPRFKGTFHAYASSLRFQSLYVIQALLGLFVLQIDRLIIAVHLNWEWVAIYFVPLGIVLKFPALLSVFNRPMLSQVAILRSKGKDVKRSFVLIILGTFWLSIIGITPSYYLIKPLVSLWISPEFADQAAISILLVFQALPFAILLMFAQSFLIALDRARTANWLSIAAAILHWLGTWIGILVWGPRGIGAGYIAEGVGALIMVWILAGMILTQKEKSKFLHVSALMLAIWVCIVAVQSRVLALQVPVLVILLLLQGCVVLVTGYTVWKKRGHEGSNPLALLR